MNPRWRMLILMSAVCGLLLILPGGPTAYAAPETDGELEAAGAGDTPQFEPLAFEPLGETEPRADSHQPQKSDWLAGVMGGLVWLVGAVEIWLVGFLVVWSLLLCLAPLRIRSLCRLLDRVPLRMIRFRDGTTFTLGHLTLCRVFVKHPRLLDAWIVRHAPAFRHWNAVPQADAGKADSTTADLVEMVRMGGAPARLDDAAVMSALLPREKFCLVLHGGDRHWSEQAAGALLKLLLRTDRRSRVLEQRTLPVVFDARRLKRIELPDSSGKVSSPAFPLIRSELKRMASVAADMDDAWLERMMASGRVIVVVHGWADTPQPVQQAIRSEYTSGRLRAVVLAGADSHAPLPDTLTMTPLPRVEGTQAMPSPSHTAPAARRGAETGQRTASPSPELVVEQLGHAIRAAAEKLSEAGNSPDARVRQQCLTELSALAEVLLPEIVESLYDSSANVRGAALASLGRIRTLLRIAAVPEAAPAANAETPVTLPAATPPTTRSDALRPAA